MLNESSYVFGNCSNLVGIRCSGEELGCQGCDSLGWNAKGSGHRPVVVMLTPGMLNSAGPMRLHVHLARELASQGISSFRFDLSGIGESLAVGSNKTSLERATDELRQALDFLANEFGHDVFMVFGLCSGADDAISSAVVDHRIRAMALMDACGYRTTPFYTAWLARKYLPKLIRPSKWADWIMQRFVAGISEPKGLPMGIDIREFPNREQAEYELRSMTERGVQMKFVYTGGVVDYYSYRDQFFDMFPSLRGRREISVSYHPEKDHVLMLTEDRRTIVDEVVGWFVETADKLNNQVASSNDAIEEEILLCG
jgi:pimeloyl-ACP methyl ester carboxylesterase